MIPWSRLAEARSRWRAAALLAASVVLTGCLFGSSEKSTRTAVETGADAWVARIDLQVQKQTFWQVAESERYWSEATLVGPGGRKWLLTLGRGPTAEAALEAVSRDASVVWARGGGRLVARAGGKLPNHRWDGKGGWLAIAYDGEKSIVCDHLTLPKDASAIEAVPAARDLAAIILGVKAEKDPSDHGSGEEAIALDWAISGRPGATDVYLGYLEKWPGHRTWAPMRLAYPRRLEDPSQRARALAIADRFETLRATDAEYAPIAAELRRLAAAR